MEEGRELSAAEEAYVRQTQDACLQLISHVAAALSERDTNKHSPDEKKRRHQYQNRCYSKRFRHVETPHGTLMLTNSVHNHYKSRYKKLHPPGADVAAWDLEFRCWLYATMAQREKERKENAAAVAAAVSKASFSMRNPAPP